MRLYLSQHIEEFARMLTLESGKLDWEAVIEFEGAARYFEYYSNQAETVEGRSIPLGADYLDFTICEPFAGYGKSGYSRGKGREALWNYVQAENIAYRTR